MFGFLKRRKNRTPRRWVRPANRAQLSIESLETRTLLSGTTFKDLLIIDLPTVEITLVLPDRAEIQIQYETPGTGILAVNFHTLSPHTLRSANLPSSTLSPTGQLGQDQLDSGSNTPTPKSNATLGTSNDLASTTDKTTPNDTTKTSSDNGTPNNGDTILIRKSNSNRAVTTSGSQGNAAAANSNAVSPDLIRDSQNTAAPGQTATPTAPPLTFVPANVTTQAPSAAATGITAIPGLPAQSASDVLSSPARFRATIQTKEGYKTATGEESPTPRAEDRRLPGAEESMLDDEAALKVGVVPNDDLTEESLAATRNLVADAFFLDDSMLNAEYLLTPNSAAALAGCAIIMGGFWGSNAKRPEDRTHRRRFLQALRGKGM